METKSKVSIERLSIKSDCANFLTIICFQELPENELANVSATKEGTSVEDRVMETNSKVAVRRLIVISSHLSDARLNPGFV